MKQSQSELLTCQQHANVLYFLTIIILNRSCLSCTVIGYVCPVAAAPPKPRCRRARLRIIQERGTSYFCLLAILRDASAQERQAAACSSICFCASWPNLSHRIRLGWSGGTDLGETAACRNGSKLRICCLGSLRRHTLRETLSSALSFAPFDTCERFILVNYNCYAQNLLLFVEGGIIHGYHHENLFAPSAGELHVCLLKHFDDLGRVNPEQSASRREAHEYGNFCLWSKGIRTHPWQCLMAECWNFSFVVIDAVTNGSTNCLTPYCTPWLRLIER